MSFRIKGLLALSLVAFVAACAAKEEPVYTEPAAVEPIQPEPTYNKL